MPKPRSFVPGNDQPKQHPVPPREPPSKVPAHLSVFEAAGIKVERPAPNDLSYPWTIADRFLFWPANGTWRSTDGRHTGYTARNLVRVIRDNAEPVNHPTLAERQKPRREALDAESMAAVARALEPEQFPERVELPADVEPQS